MKVLKVLFLLGITLILRSGYAQQEMEEATSIKLFVQIPKGVCDALNDEQKEQLSYKLVNLVSNAGSTYKGFSSFVLYPQVFITDLRYTQGGMHSLAVVACELHFYVARIIDANQVEAPLYSHTLYINGSGLDKNAAIHDAFNQVSNTDKSIIAFIKDTKIKLYDYLVNNCIQILNEARYAYKLLQNNTYAIALYNSIPSSTLCFDSAKTEMISILKMDKINQCKTKLLNLKAQIAIVSNQRNNESDYVKLLELIGQLDPTTTCYQEALKLVEKIETKLNEKQKSEWELLLKNNQNEEAIKRKQDTEINTIMQHYAPIIKLK